jgi:hypothetical protein
LSLAAVSVGTSVNRNGYQHAFLYSRPEEYESSLDMPGSETTRFGTQINALNNREETADLFTDAAKPFHGFIWSRGQSDTFGCPHQPCVEIDRINDAGNLTGNYAGDTNGTVLPGYVAFRKDRWPEVYPEITASRSGRHRRR